MNKEHVYYVKGMHCASCEVLTEKKLLEIPGVKSVDASTGKGQVMIEYEGEKPDINHINNVFKKHNYTFFENEYKAKDFKEKEDKPANPTLVAFNIALAIIIAFFFLDRMGVSGLLNVTSTSSLLAFFGFGILASLSSCAALVGGMVLSMSKQWQELYVAEDSNSKKMQPHIMFNFGRVLSYGFFGGVLGFIGSRLQPSLGFTSFLIIAVSLLMIGLGLQMLGVKAFRKFQFSAPKFITRNIADEKKFQGKYMPFFMGAATFFIPCGLTITAQTIALLTANVTQSALIMGAFALGTAPVLLVIGLSSTKLLSNPHRAERFSKAAGFLVLFFALFNLNNQMSILGFSFNNVLAGNSSQGQVQNQDQEGLPPIVGGIQQLQMKVLSVRYDPNYLKVKAGIPVRWEITTSDQPGCATGLLIARGLLNEPVYLNPGGVTVAEFTPQNPGIYRFSCSMNMVRGTIEVI